MAQFPPTVTSSKFRRSRCSFPVMHEVSPLEHENVASLNSFTLSAWNAYRMNDTSLSQMR
eukprot:31198-Pelagococcus_subviridis.AAC.14